MIEEFLIQNNAQLSPLFTRTLDFKRIAELPDEQFAQLYLELMTEYRDKDGWWSEEKIPQCSKCKKEIPNPQNLRRYHGRNLHPECFKKEYEKERPAVKGTMRKYWDRIANLVIDS